MAIFKESGSAIVNAQFECRAITRHDFTRNEHQMEYIQPGAEKQMSFEGFEKVEVDCVWSRLPKSFYLLNPSVYKDGVTFCCLLGPNPAEGVFGCGDNPEEAIRDWDCHLNELLAGNRTDGETIRYVRRAIG
jgi:hypothetical protein